MYKEKTILAIVPARGGSKGVPDKNIKLLADKPLIAWTIEEAKKSEYLDRLILSSDSSKIIDIASSYGCEVPFTRPAELASDSSRSIDAVIHAVENIPEKYDYLALLQCTSPMRRSKHIDEAIALCVEKNADSIISVCEAKKSPYCAQEIDQDGYLQPLLRDDKSFLPRQELPKAYDINGAFYMVKIDVLLERKRLIGDATLAYLMDEQSSLDIDTLFDFEIAELIIRSSQALKG